MDNKSDTQIGGAKSHSTTRRGLTTSQVHMSAVMLAQGAEGRVYLVEDYFGRPAVVKERMKKAYRVPELDDVLTKRRLVQEARCIGKARRAGIQVPCIYNIDMDNSRIVMEKVEGKTVKAGIFDGISQEEELALGKAIGDSVARLHDADIVHGDLTTSNMIFRSAVDAGKGQGVPPLVLIDFGLSMSRPTVEDKAVDLYVLERAFASTHSNSEHIVRAVIAAYRQRSRSQGPTLQKLDEVRMRGRKREMIG